MTHDLLRSLIICLTLSLVAVSAPAQAAGALIGDPLPKLTLKSVDGGAKVALHGLGRGVVAFSFYSKYCRPCRKELPALHRAVARVNAALAAQGKPTQRIKTVVLVLDTAPPKMVRQKLGKETLWLHDRERQAQTAFVPRRYPCTYLARDLRIRKINRGYGRGYEKRVEGWLRGLVGVPAAKKAP